MANVAKPTLALTLRHKLGAWELVPDEPLTEDRPAWCERVREAARNFHLDNMPLPPLVAADLDPDHRRVLRSLYAGARYPVSYQNNPLKIEGLVSLGLVGVAMRPYKRWGHECYVPMNAVVPGEYHPGLPLKGLMDDGDEP